jgi:hemoglobin
MISLDKENLVDLIKAFYAKVRKDEMLGPIFNPIIKDWDSHEIHIASFWERNLFFSGDFEGNPLKKHQEVDAFHDNIITMEHFGQWINLWLETINESYEGEIAEKAKRMARKMASFLFMNIVQGRG